jgi:hypothetical protein
VAKSLDGTIEMFSERPDSQGEFDGDLTGSPVAILPLPAAYEPIEVPTVDARPNPDFSGSSP